VRLLQRRNDRLMFGLQGDTTFIKSLLFRRHDSSASARWVNRVKHKRNRTAGLSAADPIALPEHPTDWLCIIFWGSRTTSIICSKLHQTRGCTGELAKFSNSSVAHETLGSAR
jgi:hypothetical protein